MGSKSEKKDAMWKQMQNCIKKRNDLISYKLYHEQEAEKAKREANILDVKIRKLTDVYLNQL